MDINKRIGGGESGAQVLHPQERLTGLFLQAAQQAVHHRDERESALRQVPMRQQDLAILGSSKASMAWMICLNDGGATKYGREIPTEPPKRIVRLGRG